MSSINHRSGGTDGASKVDFGGEASELIKNGEDGEVGILLPLRFLLRGLMIWWGGSLFRVI